jgi:hypothetical protein
MLREASGIAPSDPLVKLALAFLASPVKGVQSGGWTLDRLKRAEMLLVELDYYRAGPQVVKFDVKGAATVLPLVTGACSAG